MRARFNKQRIARVSPRTRGRLSFRSTAAAMAAKSMCCSSTLNGSARLRRLASRCSRANRLIIGGSGCSAQLTGAEGFLEVPTRKTASCQANGKSNSVLFAAAKKQHRRRNVDRCPATVQSLATQSVVPEQLASRLTGPWGDLCRLSDRTVDQFFRLRTWHQRRAPASNRPKSPATQPMQQKPQ